MNDEEFKILEGKVFSDIAIVRSSLSFIDQFLIPLFNMQKPHYKNYDKPLVSAVTEACYFSVSIGLGRIFNTSMQPRQDDCDLKFFVEQTLVRLKKAFLSEDASEFCRASWIDLNDDVNVRKIFSKINV